MSDLHTNHIGDSIVGACRKAPDADADVAGPGTGPRLWRFSLYANYRECPKHTDNNDSVPYFRPIRGLSATPVFKKFQHLLIDSYKFREFC